MPATDPNLELEREHFRAGRMTVIGCDEVGRGALAGPVAVGMAAIGPSLQEIPAGLRDSKLLSEKKRVALAPVVSEWVHYSAVGLASPAEVDEFGITRCLGLAGKRALAGLFEQGVDVSSSVILLDGNSDYLGPALKHPLAITTRVKADRDCASVAAASVIAKVHRDSIMIEQDAVTPGYGWAGNKGYGSPAHLQAIAELGATDFHRRTWLSATA